MSNEINELVEFIYEMKENIKELQEKVKQLESKDATKDLASRIVNDIKSRRA